MTYTIGQIEELTGIKAHVLRYWEETIPGFIPQKDTGGRRIYSQRELELVLRIKYLITEKKFTTEGAGKQILEESECVQDNIEIISQIRECQQILSEIYFLVKGHKNA